ncbi:MAG: SLC13 family permease [Nitrospiria bacterium]
MIQRHIKRVALIAGPLLAFLVPIFIEIQEHPKAAAMLGIALWMALWWMTECVPLAVTALIPLIAFPLTGIAAGKETAPRYMTSTIFLFLGGFLIAQAMEATGLHRRLALFILSRWNTSLTQILIGFAVATAFLSMWISNTATTMLMATIALAVLSKLDSQLKPEEMQVAASTLLLTIAYSANIGGMGTPVGSPPNLVFLETMKRIFPQNVPSFLQWMMIGVPVVIAGLAVLYFMEGRRLRHLPWSESAVAMLKQEAQAMGSMRREERFVAAVLCLTALAWMTRQGIRGEGFAIPGWSALLPHKGVDDGTVAIAAAFTFFVAPVKDGAPILNRAAFGRLPWGILILFGGGFAMAMGMQRSGLSESIGNQMAFLTNVSPLVMMLGIALSVTFLTEITSNTATTQVLLPILAAVAAGSGQDAVLLLATATLSASCAFMLPVATPPNAIVFGTDRVPLSAMMKAGVKLNFVMALVIVAVVRLVRLALPG